METSEPDAGLDAATVRAVLNRLGLCTADEPLHCVPLAGGVSSDIVRVDLDGRSLCVKRALPRLKVAAEWRVPVERSAHEADWLRVAGAIRPDAVPALLGYDTACGALAMAWLPPATHPVWKPLLRTADCDPGFAGEVAEVLVAIHAATAGDPRIAARFDTGALFHALRLEPYLLAAADRHPTAAARLRTLVAVTAGTRRALVHGDVSPKNILVGPRGPVLLDAECAWYGDPAFDAAFCLNHLLLKTLWHPQAAGSLLRGFAAFVQRYLGGVDWEPPAAIGRRIAALLPALMLARVDGKSPVEYLSEAADRDRVRRVALALLRAPVDHPDAVARAWAQSADAPPTMSPAAVRGPTENPMTVPLPIVPVAPAGRIERIHARRVWDSRGRPTVEVEVMLAGGATGRAIAPAGASTGTGEALDLRDGGTAFGGLDVRRALAGLEDTIAPALLGRDVSDQAALDAVLIALDGTPDRSRLGGNALVATSMALAHAAAASAGLPLWAALAGGTPAVLPLPEIQIFGGGAHAGGRLDVQDFMVIAVGADDWCTALDWTAEVYRCAGRLLAEAGRLQGVADEGGFWPAFDDNEQALAMLVRAIEAAGLRPGEDVAISLDIAASNFGRGGRYRLARGGAQPVEIDTDALAALLLGWLRRWPIVSIEDPLAEDDLDGLAAFTAAAGPGVQVVLDDAIVTHADRIRAHAAAGAGNTALIKPNQAGTLTETRAAFDAARALGWDTIVSARSGETEDTTIVHLAVGWGARQLKVGSFARSERMAKWNEGLRVGEALTGGFALPPRSAFPWGGSRG
ncbi:MAG: phosphopyruvate hydratase [Burkholderiaceae bacterium]